MFSEGWCFEKDIRDVVTYGDSAYRGSFFPIDIRGRPYAVSNDVILTTMISRMERFGLTKFGK